MIETTQPILKLYALVDSDNNVVTYIQAYEATGAIEFAKKSLDDIFHDGLNNEVFIHLDEATKQQYINVLCNRLNGCQVVELAALRQLELIVNEKLEPLFSFGGVYKHEL